MSDRMDRALSRLRDAGFGRMLKRLASSSGEADELRAEGELLMTTRSASPALVSAGSPLEFTMVIAGELAFQLGRAIASYATARSRQAARAALIEQYADLRLWLADAVAWSASERAAFLLWLADDNSTERPALPKASPLHPLVHPE